MPVRLRIVLIIAIALSGTRFAVAETEEGRQACTNDAFQFCGDAMPDRERVFRCLEARKHQISAACRANMPGTPASERAATKKLAPTGKECKAHSAGEKDPVARRRTARVEQARAANQARGA